MSNPLFSDDGNEVTFVLDEKLPDDTNLVVKVNGDNIEIHLNTNRIYSTLINKNLVIASINKKLSSLIEEFKNKIKFKKLEDSKYWDILLKDTVYEKLKSVDEIRLPEVERIIEATTRQLLNKKEIEENKRIKELNEIDEVQSKIDKAKKEE